MQKLSAHLWTLQFLLLVVNFPRDARSAFCHKAQTFATRFRYLPSFHSTKDAIGATEGAATSSVKDLVDEDQEEKSAFACLADRIVDTLIQSDLKRDTGFDGASTGWTSWVDEPSATALQECVDRIQLVHHHHHHHQPLWMRWIRSCPAPMLLELTPNLRQAVTNLTAFQNYIYTTTASLINTATGNSNDADDKNGKEIHSTTEEAEDFLQRIGMRLILLPSGSTLSCPLRAAPGAMVFGTLLLGGVTRFRLIGSSRSSMQKKRKAGERTVIVNTKKQYEATEMDQEEKSPSLSWLQYGGPERNYEALDIGPCLLLEVIILPTGLHVPLLAKRTRNADDNESHDMVARSMQWNPETFLSLEKRQPQIDPVTTTTENQHARSGSSVSAEETSSNFDVYDLETKFCSTIGGLKPQINEIARRVLDGRVVRPASSLLDDGGNAVTRTSVSHELDRIRREEMQGLLELGLQPVRGLLLYGPPGCGKTQLAREISTILDARPPKIVAAPELLDRWVGGTERMVRELFADAEYELQICGGDATKSALHVIVVDEIDAVFRKRSAADTSSEVTRASAVNQIFTKLDGIQALGNVLFIGMTNRRELLDPALLRPGRLEVQLEIPLPDKEARREILKIQFGALRERGRLSQPLCNAIDGTRGSDSKRGHFLRRLFSFTRNASTREASFGSMQDLASNRWTAGFSGADLAGLVRNAGSIALARARNQGDGGLEGLLITLPDVHEALKELQQ